MIATVAVAALSIPVTVAEAKPGDIVVTDESAGPGGCPAGGCGALFRVDPATGARSTLVAGTPLGDPQGLAFEASGQILVADGRYETGTLENLGAVLRVEPGSGAVSTLAAGPPFSGPFGVAVESSGQILVVDRDFARPGCHLVVGLRGCGGLFRVDPATGARTLLAAGVPFAFPSGVAVEGSGQILVADAGGSLFRVDPASGAIATVVTGPPFEAPFGVAVEASGQILVADAAAGPPGCAGVTGPGCGALFRVDPVSGARTTIASGPPFTEPTDVAVEASGQILVADPDVLPHRFGGVFRVDPGTGAVSTLADNAPFVDPFGVAVEPPLCRGKPATIVGSPNEDELTGSDFGDVIVGLGGKDNLRGGEGNDRICGGPGKDRLIGGPGKDRLIGGKGKDRCAGGKGKDRGKSCETEKSL